MPHWVRKKGKIKVTDILKALVNKSRDIGPILKLGNIIKLQLLPRYAKRMEETIITSFPNLLNKQDF
ncbi:hypothetical protein AMS59_11170 [Lysinibacillus sp. FJAT-14745]|nr:hypothetical protein AMS59_11170 [Lysinibacillus sp. FJAT-14745]